jgi:hypothetical protein
MKKLNEEINRMKFLMNLSEDNQLSLFDQTYEKYGCDLLVEGNEKRFCKSIECELRGNINYLRTSINALKTYSSDYLSDYKEGISAIKYDKTVDFFKSREFMVEKAKDMFEGCNEIIKLINDSMEKFIEDVVILDDKGDYSLLNKLNTNYSAIAYMITVSKYDEYYNKTTDFIIKDFFMTYDDDGNTPFMRYLENHLTNPDNTFGNILNTIKSTTKIGTNTENLAKEYLNKVYSGNTLFDFTGDYSFIDMIGIDFAIKLLDGDGVWIPIQVKTNKRDCKSSKKVGSCKNWCMYRDGNKFNIEKYNEKNNQ